jgi:hypothetical protein
MADQTQNTVPTPVSFDDVSLAHLTFNETYRVTRGAASQVVLGLQYMLTKLSAPTNEYQKSLYPLLTKLTQSVVSKYESTFLSVTDSVARQVYGANLNGHRNDGSLYRSVNSGVNRSLTYGYAQFGQLLKVLTSRLKFIVNRDPQTVKRYAESAVESASYVSLQTHCNEFLTFLVGVNDEWTKVVDTTRTQHNIQKRQHSPQTPHAQHAQHRPQHAPHRAHSQHSHVSHSGQDGQDGQGWVNVRSRKVNRHVVQGSGSTELRHHKTRGTFLSHTKS